MESKIRQFTPALARDLDAQGRCGFADLGEFAGVVRSRAVAPQQTDPRLERIKEMAAATGQSQANDAEGGILVPPTFSSAIWRRMNEVPTDLLRLCDVYLVEGESLNLLACEDSDRRTSFRHGGMQGAWLSEAAQRSASVAKWRSVRLEPDTLGVFVYVTEKLTRNSAGALGRFLEAGAAAEISFMTGDAIVEGNGVGQPLGILNSDSLITIAKETSQVAATIVRANLSKMWARLHPRSRSTAVWLCNPAASEQLDGMVNVIQNLADSENVGGGTSPIYDAVTQTIHGRPIIWCEYCSALGTPGDVILADLESYIVATRGTPKTELSMHLKFDRAEGAYRFTFSVAGQSWVNSPISPFKGGDSVSPCLALAERA